MKCRICSSEIDTFIDVKEMVLGYRDSFKYGACSNCKTIQIKDIPENLAYYYPESYYSLKEKSGLKSFGWIKSKLLISRDRYGLGIKKTLLGKIISGRMPVSAESGFLASQFVHSQLIKNKDVKIHDAGCGTGQFLNYFNALGFKNLSGSDPFINEPIDYGNYKVYKGYLKDVQGIFDVITLNHVFEHVPNPLDYLQTVNSKLKADGMCLVRMPMAFSYGYNKYKSNWVGLEAPRHLHIFAKEGFRNLADKCGFEVLDIKYDAVGWHYKVSEAYANDISLNEITLFKPDDLKLQEYESFAKIANEKHEGDTCAYYLRKK